MRKLPVSFLIFALTFFTFSVTKISAKVLSNENGTINVAKNEVINDDLLIAAREAVIDGVVNGDVFVGAESVTINGTINGNLHAVANNIDLNGVVKNNTYAGAGNVSLTKANIGGSLLTASGSVNIDKDSIIGGSVFTGASNVNLNSQVKRSVYLIAGDITIGANAKIGKDLYYKIGDSSKDILIEKGAVVTGETHKTISQPTKVDISQNQIVSTYKTTRVYVALISFLGALIVGFFYLRFFNNQFVGSANILSKSFWKSLGIGFLVIITSLPALILMLITIIGLPVAGIVFLIFILYTYLAKIVAGLALGNWVVKLLKWNKTSTYTNFALGLLVIYIIKSVPLARPLASFIILCAGLGALTIYTFSKTEK